MVDMEQSEWQGQWYYGKKLLAKFRQSILLWTDTSCYKLVTLHLIDTSFATYFHES